MRVLVTDGRLRKSLAAVRSLGRRGAEVIAAGESPFDQALHSRHAAKHVILPSPQRAPERFLIALERAVRAHECDVVLPMSDHATAAVVARAGGLPDGCRLAVPPAGAYALLQNKWRLYALARRLGMEAPATWRPTTEPELRRVATQVRYPCVLKPVSGAGAIGMQRARSADELLACHPRDKAPRDVVFDGRWPIIQEFVAGTVHEVCALYDHGRLVQAMTQRRLRMWPPTGGPGVFNEATDEPDLTAAADRLLGEVGWHGPAQVEFVRRAQDGRPVLLEVNTRFWGTLELGIRAGVDFAWLTCLLALGRPLPADGTYRVGLRHAWLQPFALLALARGRWRETGIECLASRQAGTDLSAADWQPHVAAALGGAARLLCNGPGLGTC